MLTDQKDKIQIYYSSNSNLKFSLIFIGLWSSLLIIGLFIGF